MHGNRLSGAIPTELGSLTSLTRLSLGDNQLTGAIPTQLGSLTSLQWLQLHDNQLTGAIPTQLGSLSSLTSLDLHANRLTGAIPDELGSLTSLEGLWLYDNQLSGAIPTQLGSLSSLTSLDLGGNLLSGDIPARLGNMKNLRWLGLWGNRLTGAIPAELGDLAYLSGLDLSHNRLSGQIPAELGDLDGLTRLWLGDNQLTGQIPAELGNLTRLGAADPADSSQTGDLWLAQNRLSGCVPASLLVHLGDINPQHDDTSLTMCAGLVISPAAVTAQEGAAASGTARVSAELAAEVVVGGAVTVGPQAAAPSLGRAAAAAAARRAPALPQGESGSEGDPDANAHEQHDASPAGDEGAQPSVGVPSAARRTGEPQTGPSGAAASSGATPASSVDVGEGGTASYTVRLATQPAASVSVAISAATDSDSDITFNPSTLTFTASNWDRTQTVTVSAAQDNDGASGTAVLSHATTSTDPSYSGLTSEATVRETDNDTALNATAVNPTSAYLFLSNSSSAWYYKQTSPTAGTCSSSSVDAGSDTRLVSLKPNTSYTYKAYSDSACSTANELTSDDTDAEFTTASGVYTTPSSRITVNEGSAATYHVRLVSQPTADVTVTIAAATGSDSSLTFDTDNEAADNQNTLTLTSSNWQNGLPVVVSAAHDTDTANGTATFTHTPDSTDASYSSGVVSIVAAERDDDAQLAGYAATASGATLLISNHDAAWHYRRSSPAQGDCSPQIPASIASATVVGLAGGTTHTFKAYADPRCTIELTTDDTDAEFTTATATLAASSVTTTGAKLTIAGHTGPWRNKHSVPAGGDCSDEIAASTASTDVTGLTPGTRYTFKAYSDATCTAEITTDATDAEFTTATATSPGGNNPGGGAPGGGSPGGGGGGGGGGAARPERLSGADRYATAKAVADKLVELLETVDPATGVRTQVDTVIIASGQAFPDALTAAALSRVLRAPVLLTSKNRLEAPVRAFVARHRPATAVIVGGPAAISEAVESELQAMNEITNPVVRHAGRDRYDTAAKVAQAVGAPQRLCGTAKPTVIVTTGRNYPDALVAGPLAYRGQHPILLTNPDALPGPTRDWLDASGAKHAVVIGGAKAVSPAVLDELESLGLTAERLSGADRADTSAKVARKLTSLVCATDRFRKDAIGLATGWAFPDALAAAPLLGHYGAPLLLTSPHGVPQPLIDYATDGLLEPDFDLPPINTIGGRTAVPTSHYTKLLANLPR